ncbi:MAG: hypothetical protein RBR02_06295 [Desulfuromonadaceae bacterium]|nr:hypothetical protein [Desulfuromonadaceae bacterium]
MVKKVIYVDDKEIYSTYSKQEARKVFDTLAIATINGKTDICKMILGTKNKIIDAFVR